MLRLFPARSTRALAFVAATSAASLFLSFEARAQTFDSNPTGAPPPDAKALVTAQKEKDEPKFAKPTDSTTATLAAGGMQTAGNARFLAATGNGAFEIRRGLDGFGAGFLGNYGRTAVPGAPWDTTAQNVQLKVRYDRYLTDVLSAFLIATVRHDKFQGIDFRLNLDPGLKYLFVREATYSFWGEGGYDLQIDRRRQEDVDRAAAAKQALPPGVDHSSRLFAGYKQAFNKEVTLSTGLEYLQSFVTSDRYRFNYEVVFAARVKGGLALGLGFTARFDNAPVPGKERLDTATTLSVIYSYSDAKVAAPASCPVCFEPPVAAPPRMDRPIEGPPAVAPPPAAPTQQPQPLPPLPPPPGPSPGLEPTGPAKPPADPPAPVTPTPKK